MSLIGIICQLLRNDPTVLETRPALNPFLSPNEKDSRKRATIRRTKTNMILKIRDVAPNPCPKGNPYYKQVIACNCISASTGLRTIE